MTRLEISRNDIVDTPVDLSALFALIPDEVVLSVSTRDLNLDDPFTCLCGWVLREHIARTLDVDADYTDMSSYFRSVPAEVANRYGGSEEDWRAVFQGVTDSRMRLIEQAWVDRVLQATANAEKPKIELPADIFDTLELSAYAFGGIGGGLYNDGYEDVTDYVGEYGQVLPDGIMDLPPRLGAPVCAVGHAAFAAIPKRFDWWGFIDGNTITANDQAVIRVNERKGKTESARYDRITFEEWKNELNVVRGS